MNFNMNSNLPVAALLGAGSMGCAIIRRIGAGKTILLGESARKISKPELRSSAPAAMSWKPAWLTPWTAIPSGPLRKRPPRWAR
jgi:hypothetical protein